MIELRANQHPVRIVLSSATAGELPADFVKRARLERQRTMRRLYRRRPDVRAKQRAYDAAYRKRPGQLEKSRAQKRAWRSANRAAVNAYFRRYDELTPGRREYKARKAREYRARDRARRAAGAGA